MLLDLAVLSRNRQKWKRETCLSESRTIKAPTQYYTERVLLALRAAQVLDISGEGLSGEQVHGDSLAVEGIDRQHVKLLRSAAA